MPWVACQSMPRASPYSAPIPWPVAPYALWDSLPIPPFSTARPHLCSVRGVGGAHAQRSERALTSHGIKGVLVRWDPAVRSSISQVSPLCLSLLVLDFSVRLFVCASLEIAVGCTMHEISAYMLLLPVHPASASGRGCADRTACGLGLR